ncbi:serine/threonine-protein kinase [Nonomuraea soli]|uniref:non-specific serine/threonine protein kinase n=1 Tax=Nonomuraea soli TaxID=1032476 RepID=A0A7W0CM53_9ACTN|nr:serine/threonine-protein kinase [Nonomuraea soli]MBA2893641.1 serine/threonine-protein kinase [Nonomuraea soli]
MYGIPDGQWEVPGYTTVRELGAGASGRVVLATADHDGSEVAIKYLSEELRADVGFVARFRHEARLLTTVRSPYNARFIDYVESGHGAAIVMELVDGVPLRDILSSEGPTGPEAALAVLKGSLQGLAAAHAVGVVHRDYKPENVVVQADGTSKLVDFGIAVRAGAGASAAGTPSYMAPEQWSGASAAPATDVYAATAVFFECLTGTRPYRAANIAALAHMHHSAPPPIEHVPEALQGLVERGLAKNSTDRPPSAEAFLTELEAVAAGAYGERWEERGRRRLAGLAGLLPLLFPSGIQEAPIETGTSLAHSRVGESATKRVMTESRSLIGKLGVKVAVGVVATGVVVGAIAIVLTGQEDPPKIQTQAAQGSPSPLTPAAIEPVETPTEEPTEEPTAEPTETAEPSQEPSQQPSGQPTVAPPSATPSASPSVKPPKPSTSPTAKPSASATDDPPGKQPEYSGGTKSPAPKPPTPTTRPPAPTSEPQPTRTTSRPTTPPTTPTPSETGEPEPTRTSTNEPTIDSPGVTSTPTGEPTPPRKEGVAGALLGLGLVTSGTMSVTLAVKGRHRRKR